jgi:ABC-type polysaccharide/polyol phosphate export permease
VNALIASAVLLVLFATNGFAPRATSVWVPAALAVLLVFTVGTTLLVSSVVVYLRDVRHALPIAMQLGLFATPVAYGMEAIPARFHDLYAVCNPLGPVIQTLRRAVLFGAGPDWSQLGPAAAAASVWLVVGWAVFKRLEVGFADVA